MDAIRGECLATSVREERLSARQIVRHHQHCIESLARPAYHRLFWGPVWLVGERLDLYRWYCLPRSESVLGELFLAAIPHPSPLASQVFDVRRVARLLDEIDYARMRRPTRARGCRQVEELGLMALEE